MNKSDQMDTIGSATDSKWTIIIVLTNMRSFTPWDEYYITLRTDNVVELVCLVYKYVDVHIELSLDHIKVKCVIGDRLAHWIKPQSAER